MEQVPLHVRTDNNTLLYTICQWLTLNNIVNNCQTWIGSSVVGLLVLIWLMLLLVSFFWGTSRIFLICNSGHIGIHFPRRLDRHC